MWVRGLKLSTHPKRAYRYYVAPYVGAWIETNLLRSESVLVLSHPMWVRGLKLIMMIN